MSPKRKKVLLSILGLVIAAGLGVGVALLVTGTDDEDKTSETATVTETERTDTETATEVKTLTGNIGGTQTETVTVTSPQVESPEGAASKYASDKFGINLFEADSVTRSKIKPVYALVTAFDDDTPIAIWVRRTGGRWVAIAGTKDAKPAPAGKGIPPDIATPFSEGD